MYAPISKVARPVSDTIQNHGSVPPSAGYSRASRNTPAFTIVAECRYADTGVGAAIAWGSQKWNGNCALLVKQPSSTSTSAGTYSGCARSTSPDFNTVSSSVVPTIWPITSTPASRHSPPAPVTASAMRAPSRASARWRQKPISRNDDRLVSSQNTTSSIRLSAITRPSMAPMNSMRNRKKRAGGSSSAR